MQVRFWGVRGSFPVPGPTTNRYGGNTACVQVCPDDGSIIIIDAGTGIRRLGQQLMKDGADRGKVTCHLLVSHTHWDHIQGLPFFAPLYVKGNVVNIYARQREIHLEDIFATQTREPYFSMHIDEVAATVRFIELIEGACFRIGSTRVTCARLNHPNIAVGYRLDADGASVAYISDTAPFDKILFSNQFIARRPESPPSEADTLNLEVLRDGALALCQDADLAIYDTMFLPEDYLERPHWGHSTHEHALELAAEAGAASLALYHYSPDMTDHQVDALIGSLQGQGPPRVIASAEGLSIPLGSRTASTH